MDRTQGTEAEAVEVTIVRTVAQQKRAVRFAGQSRLRYLPADRTPIPTTLKQQTCSSDIDAEVTRDLESLQRTPLIAYTALHRSRG